MKQILVILLFSFQAFAATESVHSSGYASGFCQGGGFGSMCMSQLQDLAKQDAARDADLQCRIKNGKLISYSGYCNVHCSPPYLNGEQNTYVSCNSSCRFDCDIKKP